MNEPQVPGRHRSGEESGVADVLAAQAAELASVNEELIRSYEKELAFLGNLEKVDERDNTRVKKIWWLEQELRKRQEEIVALRADLQRTRSALHNLQSSPMGRMQRSYWKMRQGARR